MKMIIFCEECGERYMIESTDIVGSAMMFACSACQDIIRISKPPLPYKQNTISQEIKD